MKKYDWGDIDEPIRDVIERLNRLGYVTTESCCGFQYPTHLRKHHGNPFIHFEGTEERIVPLIRALGFTWCAYFVGAIIVWGVSRNGSYLKPDYCWDIFRKALDKLEVDDETRN